MVVDFAESLKSCFTLLMRISPSNNYLSFRVKTMVPASVDIATFSSTIVMTVFFALSIFMHHIVQVFLIRNLYSHISSFLIVRNWKTQFLPAFVRTACTLAGCRHNLAFLPGCKTQRILMSFALEFQEPSFFAENFGCS